MKRNKQGVFAAVRMAAGTHRLLTAGTLLCAAASVLASLLRAIQLRLDRRAGGALSAGALLFSNVYGELGRTETAREVLQEWETAFSMA